MIYEHGRVSVVGGGYSRTIRNNRRGICRLPFQLVHGQFWMLRGEQYVLFFFKDCKVIFEDCKR